MKIRKKLAFIMMSAIVMSIGLTTKAQAKDFGISLAPNNSWRYLTNAEDCRDLKQWMNYTQGYIKLNRIHDATSYYVRGRAVNSDGDPRSTEETIKQYGPKVYVTEKGMEQNHWYYICLKNNNYTSEYVWTTGQFGWY
ncbi:hypothetical protein ACV3RS_16370 [Clostridium perfringens]